MAKHYPGGIEQQRYVYGPDTVINEFNWQDQLTARYDVGADRLRGEIGGEGSRFYFSDALGSVTALAGVANVNNQAQPFVAARYEY